MPRVPIALNGFSQVPDEHGGPPRIARLINARVDAPNRIAKTPGTIAIPTTQAPAGTLKPISYGVTPSGVSFCVSRMIPAIQRGARVFALESSTWVASESGMPFIGYDEAARSEPIFTDPNYSYNAPGVMDLGDGDFVVVAEALSYFAGSGAGAFLSSVLHWALVSGGDLKVKTRGNYNPGMPPGDRIYPVTAGPYVVAWTDLGNLGVYRFNRATGELVEALLLPYGSAIWASGSQIDATYDPIQERLFVAGPQSNWWWIDAVNWTIVQSGNFVFTPVLGTMGVSVCSSITLGQLYVVYRSSTTQWMAATFTITDLGLTSVGSSTLIYTSLNDVSGDPGFVKWRAGVTAFADSGWNYEGASVVVYEEPRTTDDPSCSSVVLILKTDATVRRQTMSTFASFPASKPYVRAWDGTPTIPMSNLWVYPTQGRSLRGAINLAEGQFVTGGASDDYPRATHYAFRAAQPGPTPTERLVGAVNAVVYSATGINGKPGYLTAMCCQKHAGVDSAALDVYLVSHCFGDSLVESGELPEVLQQAHGNDATIFATANPGQFNGRIEIPGAQYPPRNPKLTHAGAGTTPAAGTYVYVVVREWKDTFGRVYRSPVSDPITIVKGAGGTTTVDCYDDPWENGLITLAYGFPGSVTKIFRTTNGGSVFYNVSGIDGIVTPGMSSAPVSFTDATPDATLISGEILYTQGANGGNSGLLDWWGPPPCRCLWTGTDRQIAGGLEDEHRVQFSNLFFGGEQISWPEDSAFQVILPEPITAVAALDNYWLAFAFGSVYLITGQGPDPMGVGSFDAPRKISANVGARSWRSVVETPEGIMFQASDGQIYVVQRGSFQVVMKSAPVRDSIAIGASSNASPSLASASDTDDPNNWVVGAVYDSFASEVWFFNRSSNAWVYGTQFGDWREEVSTVTAGTLGFHAGRIKTATTDGPAFIRILSGVSTGYRIARRSDTATYTDWLGGARYMNLISNDIELVHGRLVRAWVKLHREIDEATPHYGVSRASVWFDGLRNNIAQDEFRYLGSNNTTVPDISRFVDMETDFARQKCNQFRIAWSDCPMAAQTGVSPSTLNLAAYVIGFDVEITQTKQRSVRYASGVGRTT